MLFVLPGDQRIYFNGLLPVSMHLIELSDYTLAAVGSGSGIQGFHFALAPGDVCAIESHHPDDAHMFLRALAGMARPLKGRYRFQGRERNLHRYLEMLECKKQIGYVARDTTLISNLTVRQNLLLQRYYHENRLTIELSPDVRTLCETFGIHEKLDRRPSGLNAMETQAAIVIREVSKKPAVMLLGQPEDFIGHAKFDLITELFNRLIAERLPIVFLSFDRRLVRRFANRKVLITDGALTSVAVKASTGGE
jgi:ABC-type molybdate transport system ATPase subunit